MRRISRAAAVKVYAIAIIVLTTGYAGYRYYIDSKSSNAKDCDNLKMKEVSELEESITDSWNLLESKGFEKKITHPTSGCENAEVYGDTGEKEQKKDQVDQVEKESSSLSSSQLSESSESKENVSGEEEEEEEPEVYQEPETLSESESDDDSASVISNSANEGEAKTDEIHNVNAENEPKEDVEESDQSNDIQDFTNNAEIVHHENLVTDDLENEINEHSSEDILSSATTATDADATDDTDSQEGEVNSTQNIPIPEPTITMETPISDVVEEESPSSIAVVPDLFNFIESEDFEAFKSKLQSGVSSEELWDNAGYSILHRAAIKCLPQFIKTILKSKSNPEPEVLGKRCGEEKKSLAILIVESEETADIPRKIECLKALRTKMTEGAEEKGYSPLFAAIKTDQSELIKYFLANGGSGSSCYRNRPLIHYAIEYCSDESFAAIFEMLARNIDSLKHLNYRTNRAAIHEAAYHNKPSAIKLISELVQIDKRTGRDSANRTSPSDEDILEQEIMPKATALHIAIRFKNEAACKMLRELNADGSVLDFYGKTPEFYGPELYNKYFS